MTAIVAGDLASGLLEWDNGCCPVSPTIFAGELVPGLSSSALKAIPIAIALSVSGHCALAESAHEHFRRGLEFRFQGHSDAAVKEYRRGLEIDPGSVDGHVQLGSLLFEEKGDVDAAISEYVTALSIDPSCVFCQTGLNQLLEARNSRSADQVSRGNRFYSEGQLTRACAAYRVAIQIDPADATAHNSLAWTLYRIGDLSEAKREVELALKLKPDDPEFVNTLACVAFDQGDVDGAIVLWRKAIGLSKTPNPADLYGMALGMLARGDRSLAGRYFNDALKSDPRYRDVRYVRDRIGMSVKAIAPHEQLLSLTGQTHDRGAE